MGKIQGIGVDVVDVQRMRDVLENQGKVFLDKVFSDMEVTYCKTRKKSYIHFAARFAAKENVRIADCPKRDLEAKPVYGRAVAVAHEFGPADIRHELRIAAEVEDDLVTDSGRTLNSEYRLRGFYGTVRGFDKAYGIGGSLCDDLTARIRERYKGCIHRINCQ